MSVTNDIDSQLRAFFRREMPSTWPKCPRVAAPGRQPARLPRLALAASLLLLVGGYLALAGWFPRASVAIEGMPGQIGSRVKAPPRPDASPAPIKVLQPAK